MFIDADSCPVKEEIVDIASHFSIKTLFIASYNHVKNDISNEEWIFVDIGKEAADIYIMNHASRGDVVITQDIGLASTLLAKMVHVISPKGVLFAEKDIQTALEVRYLNAKARRQGKYEKGPKPFTLKDREKFAYTLTKNLSDFAGI